jgi:hypothetical protein
MAAAKLLGLVRQLMNLVDRFSTIIAFKASAPATRASASPCAVVAVSTCFKLLALDHRPAKSADPALLATVVPRPCPTVPRN